MIPPRYRTPALKAGAFLLAGVLLQGCALEPVQPWQKGALAKPGMLLEQDRLEGRYAEHIYTSKEGAARGNGVGGGGCGCN
jgi:hypothetical protein